jgi:site-specific recombinase XerC
MTNTTSTPQPAYSKKTGPDDQHPRLMKDGKLGWRCRVYSAKLGRQVESTFYGTKRQAQDHIDNEQVAIKTSAAPTLPKAQYVTVGMWALEFLRTYHWKQRPTKKSPGVVRNAATYNNARAVVRAYIVPGLGEHTRMAAITPDRLYEMVADLLVTDFKLPAAERKTKTKPADPDTQEKVASITRLMFKAAVPRVLTVNPAEKLATVWGADRARAGRIVLPSLIQTEQLACSMDAEWKGRGDIVRVFAYTGMRWESLSGLRWADVDFNNRSILLWRSAPSGGPRYEQEGTKGRDDYYITILDQALEPLQRLRGFAQARGSEYVLTGERGGPLNYSLWRKHLDKARAATGVDYTGHSLRHVCASILIAAGRDHQAVADQMGHRNPNVTRRVYRHAMKMDRTKLAAELSSAVTTIRLEETDED